MSTTTDTAALDKIAALLGSQFAWNEAGDLLDDIADYIAQSGRPNPGQGTNNAHYRELADSLRIAYYEAEDEV